MTPQTTFNNLKRILTVYGGRLGCLLILLVLFVLCAGCSTSFKYTPASEQAYSATAARSGLAISTGVDSRPAAEIRPEWAEDAESIVAHALAEEIRDAKLFDRVKIHADSVSLKKYSEVVRFRVEKFECYNQPGFFESMGLDLLRSRGTPGVLSAASIPTKYVCEVAVEFEVLDASTRQSKFIKSYAATRTVELNGYQSDRLEVKPTSDALAEVLTQFVADLAKLP